MRRRAASPTSAIVPTTEFCRRVQAELEAELAWPPAVPAARRRARGDRSPPLLRRRHGRGAWPRPGKAVLALCADAVRRRELVERAARPARFGGGEVAIVSARLPDAAIAAAETRVTAAGAGVVLADWAALARDPGLAGRFEHLVADRPAAVRPPRTAVPRRRGLPAPPRRQGRGRVRAARACRGLALARLARRDLPLAGRAAAGPRTPIEPAAARAILCGEGRTHPLAPEVAARAVRVLAELELVAWDGSGALSAPGVVSSEGTDLDRSRAFVAYRDRYEEGRRFLSERRQS